MLAGAVSPRQWTVSTGHGAVAMTWLATLPMTSFLMPVRPCVPIDDHRRPVPVREEGELLGRVAGEDLAAHLHAAARTVARTGSSCFSTSLRIVASSSASMTSSATPEWLRLAGGS